MPLPGIEKAERRAVILSADVDYLKNEQPVNPSVLALEKCVRKSRGIARW